MKYMTAIFSEFSSGMGNIPDFFYILIEISWVQFLWHETKVSYPGIKNPQLLHILFPSNESMVKSIDRHQ